MREQGPYYNNEHKDGPDGGNKTNPPNGKSVKQGKSAVPEQSNQGYSGKMVGDGCK